MSRVPQLIARAFYRIGLFRLVSTIQRNKITFIMLHGVMAPNSDTVWEPLRTQYAPEQLAAALAVLSRYYHFISLPDAVAMLTGLQPIKPNSLVFTFDDGYRNNLTHALPILRRFNAPATIFLSTGNIDQQKPFWFDRLDYAVQTAGRDGALPIKIPELAGLDFANRESLARSFVAFLRKEKKRYPTDALLRNAMETLTDRLEQYSGKGLADILATDPWSGVLTWEEVQNAAKEVCFGSHGVNHPLLALCPAGVARSELETSRETIEKHTGIPCRHLAYPGGSFNPAVVALARESGYTSAVTTVPGLNRLGDEPLTIKRIAFPRSQVPASIFAAITGISSRWRRRSANFFISGTRPNRDAT